MILSVSFLLLCINKISCENNEPDNGSRGLNFEKKLNSALLDNYDPLRSPLNTTIVTVRFILKYFYFDSNEEILTIYNWIFIKWVDERLQWDPKDYGGLTEALFDSHHIWTPRLKHMNNIAYEDDVGIFNSGCQVLSSGRVTSILRVVSQTECSSNLTNWPYDTQSCPLRFGVNSNHKDNAVLTFNSSRGISMFGSEYGPGWTIIDFKKGENASSETQFYLTFIMERQAESLGTIIIIPSVVLSVLSISSLFLDVDNTREGIAILSLIGHLYISNFLNVNISKYGSTNPSILRFMSGSFVFTIIIILLIYILGSLRRKVVMPPMWIVSMNGFVFKSLMKFLIWPRWRVRNLIPGAVEPEKAIEIWTDFANVVNSCIIILTIIVYVSMFLSLMPKQMPIDYLT